MQKTAKKIPYRCGQKYVETYNSSSDAAAQDPEEGTTDQYTINTLQDTLSRTKITNEKENRGKTRRLTDLE